MTRALLVLVALAACRGGPTTVRYAGPPVAQCLAGRAYQPPPIDAPTRAFVPLAPPEPVEVAPIPPEVEPDPPADEPPRKPVKPRRRGRGR